MTGILIGSPLFLSAQKKTEETDTEPVKIQKAPPFKDKSSSDKKSQPVPVPEEPEQNRLFRKDVILQINEIIKKIQKNYPALSDNLSDAKKIAIFKSLVNTLNRGMEYIPADEMSSMQKVEQANEEPMPAIIIASNQILYIRIKSFAGKSLQQLKEDCENSAKLAKKPMGIILDLRNSQGENYISALNAAGLFASSENLKKIGLQSGLKQTLKSPVIILTGEDTKGASEVFTTLLINMKRGISLGGSTAGIPFQKRKTVLTNGDFLMIPQIPENLEMIIPESIKPSITFSPYPQLCYKRLKEEAGAEKEDKCIQRAVELIICLNALSK